MILYTAIQQLENNLLVPKVIGDAVDLHPAVIILALVAGGALFGIGGAILAAPTVAHWARPVPVHLPPPARRRGRAAFMAVAPKVATHPPEPEPEAETPPEPAKAEPAAD